MLVLSSHLVKIYDVLKKNKNNRSNHQEVHSTAPNYVNEILTSTHNYWKINQYFMYNCIRTNKVLLYRVLTHLQNLSLFKTELVICSSCKVVKCNSLHLWLNADYFYYLRLCTLTQCVGRLELLLHIELLISAHLGSDYWELVIITVSLNILHTRFPK